MNALNNNLETRRKTKSLPAAAGSGLIQARNGHKETVDLPSKGKLKLSRIRKI
jgi:hypothetical protein